MASISGFVQEPYQVTVDPVKLRAYGISQMNVTQVIRDIGLVERIPDERRGLTELNCEGEVISGIAMARYGENALEVIGNLKAKIDEIASGLPAVVSVEMVNDRSEMIHRAIDTLKCALPKESLIVALVCFAFLLNIRSALVDHPDHLHRHARARHELEPDEPGRHRYYHRSDDRRGYRHNRKRAQASRTPVSRLHRCRALRVNAYSIKGVWPVAVLTARLGSEFIPTLNEETLFYMPASLPRTKAAEILKMQNKIIKSYLK